MSSIEREKFFKRLLCLELKYRADSNRIELKDIEYGTYIEIADKYNTYVYGGQFSNIEIAIICSNLWSGIKETNNIIIKYMEWLIKK